MLVVFGALVQVPNVVLLLARNQPLYASIAAGRNVSDTHRLGVPVEQDRNDFIQDAVTVATRAFEPGMEEDKMRETVRLAVRRCATLWTGKKPLVEVSVVRAG